MVVTVANESNDCLQISDMVLNVERIPFMVREDHKQKPI